MSGRVAIADARSAPAPGVGSLLQGFGPLLRMQLLGFRRSWPGPVLVGAFVFLAALSPVTARWAPELIAGLAPGVPIELPDPTWVDSSAQWLKNLNQIGTLLAVVAAAGTIAGEVRDGAAVLVLTKPASRTAFVLAAFVASAALVAAAAVAGLVVAGALTLVLFPGAPLLPLLGATAAWLLYAFVLVAITIWASAAMRSPLPAVGVGIGVWLAMSIAGIWEPLARWTPLGLGGLAGTLGAGGSAGAAAIAWPVLTGIALVALLLAGAVATFRRREL